MKVSDEQIVSALLTTTTNAQAAVKCGLSENQLYRRMREDSFKTKYKDARAQMLEQATALMQKYTGAAVATMVEIMRDKDNSAQVRLNASDAIIRNGLKLTEQYEILSRLEALEKEAHLND